MLTRSALSLHGSVHGRCNDVQAHCRTRMLDPVIQTGYAHPLRSDGNGDHKAGCAEAIEMVLGRERIAGNRPHLAGSTRAKRQRNLTPAVATWRADPQVEDAQIIFNLQRNRRPARVLGANSGMCRAIFLRPWVGLGHIQPELRLGHARQKQRDENSGAGEHGGFPLSFVDAARCHRSEREARQLLGSPVRLAPAGPSPPTPRLTLRRQFFAVADAACAAPADAARAHVYEL